MQTFPKNPRPARPALSAQAGTTRFICAVIAGRPAAGIQTAEPPMETAPEKMASAPAPNPLIPRQCVRILLVDDDLYARELSAGALLRAGYQVETAEDGADAWQALNENSYDLLITDNRMPRVTGLELIQKLRSVDTQMPVILASGTVPAEELARQPALRVTAALPKPFTSIKLLATVKSVLQTAQLAHLPAAAGPGRAQEGR